MLVSYFHAISLFSFNENTQSMERGYPRKIATDFQGIGHTVDAALQKNGKYIKMQFIPKKTSK